MIGRIEGATHDLGKPKDWDDSKGKCWVNTGKVYAVRRGMRIVFLRVFRWRLP